MADLLPLDGESYDQSNEQRARTTIEERLTDIEQRLYNSNTSYGTISLGMEEIDLVNGTNNNVPPGYATFARIIGPTAAFTITGILQGEFGRLLILRNTVAFNMTIANESGSSDAANRIFTQTGADFTTTAEGSVILIYDSIDERWILVGADS